MIQMQYEIKQLDKFRFIEEGEGEPLVLLHGLFGALSNFQDLIEYFRNHYTVVVPILPLFDLDILHTSVSGLQKFVHKFMEAKDLRPIWMNFKFNIDLRQSHLATLEDQARWAMARGYAAQGPVPNFLPHLYTDALLAVQPERMTVLR